MDPILNHLQLFGYTEVVYYWEPVHHITSDYPPCLLLHGEKDSDVPYEQALIMKEALQEKGIPHQFIHDADWGHVFDSAGLQDVKVQKAFDQMIEFLNKYLK